MRISDWSSDVCSSDLVRGKPVSSLTREDVIAYEAFLAQPPATWCDDGLARRGEHRRLFVGPLAERSRRQALGILAGLFNYLVRAGSLAGRPFLQIGSASGRERVCHEVSLVAVAVLLNKNHIYIHLMIKPK